MTGVNMCGVVAARNIVSMTEANDVTIPSDASACLLTLKMAAFWRRSEEKRTPRGMSRIKW